MLARCQRSRGRAVTFVYRRPARLAWLCADGAEDETTRFTSIGSHASWRCLDVRRSQQGSPPHVRGDDLQPAAGGSRRGAGLPDLQVTIEELVAEGDKVAVRRSYAGTHRGELLGIPATGKQVRISGISIFRLAGGKIAEHWEQLDRLALMQQLGALPTPGQGAS